MLFNSPEFLFAFLPLALVLHGSPQFGVETFDSIILAEHLAAPGRSKGLILATFARLTSAPPAAHPWRAGPLRGTHGPGQVRKEQY